MDTSLFILPELKDESKVDRFHVKCAGYMSYRSFKEVMFLEKNMRIDYTDPDAVKFHEILK